MADLTVIIPVYNEECAIENTINTLKPFAEKNHWRIIAVNDGSTDKTGEILARLPGIKTVSHLENKGYGAALSTGIINAESRLVAFYDADGQHNPGDLEQLVQNLGGYDMMVGKRGKDSHRDWLRRPGKWILSKIANFLTARKIPDLNSGLRVIRRDIILNLLHLMPPGFSFSTTSTVALINLGFNVGYHPIKVSKRVGKSTVNPLKHGTTTILLIIRLILLFNPLKVFGLTSLFLFTVGTIYEILYGILWRPEHARLIPGALFILLTAVIIFFLGLVVDQISALRKSLHFEKLLETMQTGGTSDPSER